MKNPIGGEFEEPPDHEHHLGSMQTIDLSSMRRYSPNEELDYLVVGVGAAGGVLLQRLARAGFRVAGLEAGPFWDTEKDWVSDEKGSHQLYWEDMRITGGSHPLTFGANNSGKGVGGGSVHWAAFTPRFHPSDFEIHTRDGVGTDWPMSYWDLKPYYELLELEMPVAGPAWYPWGDPHGYAYAPHPMGGVGNVLIKGCTSLGIGVSAGGPVAILSGSRNDRPHCIYRGFCIQGCKVGAKASTLITHVPDAIANGAEVRDRSMANRVHLGKNNRVTGVSYFDREGKEQFQKAKAVIISGYAIETPRLLLNSELANSSGTVGRYLMAQAGNVVLGRFEELVRQYK
ncbi:MAG: GMC family oxidoreductase N-terminal domain-containing protein, partial [Chthoniobacterales bacterium]